MKNLFALITLVFSCIIAFGQHFLQPDLPGRTNGKQTIVERLSIDHSRGGGALWVETFAGASDNGTSIATPNGSWTKSGANGNVWKHSFTPSSGCYSELNTTPATTTPGNGFLLFDADSVNCQTNQPIGTEDQLYGSITSPNINLSGSPYVLLYFDYDFRWWWNLNQDVNFYIDLSGDGGNTWPVTHQLDEDDINEFQNGTAELIVSSTLGNSSQAKVRFRWEEYSHYYWVIDDVRIMPQPQHDIRIESTFISHNNSGTQYGIVPSNQTGQTMAIGAEVYNLGYADQTNLNLTADFDFGLFTATASHALLQTDSTVYMEGTASQVLTNGVEGWFEVVSDDETQFSLNFWNNQASRNINVSCETCWDGLYAMDNIAGWQGGSGSLSGYPSIGTNTFTAIPETQDGFGLYSIYHVQSALTFSGIEILLDTANTEVGAQVIAALHSANGFVNTTPEPFNSLVTSENYIITQADIDAQRAFIPFEESYEVTNDSVYAGVYLFSLLGANNVAVLDDESRTQPSWSSCIYVPGYQVYTNGEALAVRLKTCQTSAVSETACGSYNWNGNTYTQSGLYGGVSGPASCETLDLTILPVDPNTTWNYDLCPGDTVWFDNGGLGTPTMYDFNQPGQYIENVLNANGCISVDTVIINAVSPPAINILGNTNVSPNSAETYAFADPGGYTFTWSAINGTILGGQGTTSVDIFWDASGGGQVILELEGQCDVSDTLTVGTFVGIENQLINDLQIHPNPSTGIFNMELTEPTLIIVMDARGRKIVETNGNGQFSLDLNGFSKGTYIVQVQTSKGLYSEKLILQ